jgi:uncharacterized protein
MPIIHYHAPIKLLVAVRGHPFDRSAFDAMFLAMDEITATMVDQPAAAQLMNPAGVGPYDALVLENAIRWVVSDAPRTRR